LRNPGGVSSVRIHGGDAVERCAEYDLFRRDGVLKHDDRPIGVFDSGVGGLTVAAAIRKALPDESIIYLGDLLHLPYGSKSSRAVVEFTRAASHYLIEQRIKILVIACNTATSIARETIEAEVDIPVIGVIGPGASAACTRTKNRQIGVIGTHRTISSNAYGRAIREIDPDASVIQKATPLLVPLIEEGWTAHPITRMVLSEYFRDMGESIDTLVLGCTHYPLIRRTVADMLPGIGIVDSAETTAAEAARAIEELSLSCSPGRRGDYEIYLTDDTDTFRSIGEHILGKELTDVRLIDLDYVEGKIEYR
jgi:glutamate racemase